MTQMPVSVVVVCRNRPDALRLCLTALKFQFYEMFDIVVVSDRAGLDVAKSFEFIDPAKCVLCEIANISHARNLGIARAAGEVIAFIDDDAIAEPTWLEYLIAPFSDKDVAATGGFVRGRNGIGFQWQAEGLQKDGTPVDLVVSEQTKFQAAHSGAIKTQGTNCAFRRSVLIELGGFDLSFAFFLDETDMNWRVWQAGFSTVIVPDAQVQHRYLANDTRTGERAVKSLHQIGRSAGHFQRKHGLPNSFLQYHRELQRCRCITQMRDGLIEPGDVARLLTEFDAGAAERDVQPALNIDLSYGGANFEKLRRPKVSERSVRLSCRSVDKAATFGEAKEQAAKGIPVTVFSFSRTSLFHKRWFHPDGFWVQTGGLYGKSYRSDPYFQKYKQEQRCERESASLEKFRRFLPIPDQ